MTKLSDYVMDRVSASGVGHVFLVPGGAAMHLNDSLAGLPGVKFVATYHEHAAVVAAEAYAKLTGKLGVALVTAGPGSTNCLTGVMSAWVNSAPLLIISGQVKRSDLKDGKPLRQLGLQEVNIISIVRSVTKYAVTVTDPATIRHHMDIALSQAQTGRPGPVWLDIPLDVQSAMIETETLPAGPAASIPANSHLLPQQVASILNAIRGAERPIFLLGAGVRISGGAALALEMINRLGIPYATTWVGADLIYDAHPCFAGRPGAFAPRGANFAIQNSDVLVSIGARWDLATTGFSPSGFARAAQRFVVDVDAAELDKLRPSIENCIHSDAREFLVEMIRQLDTQKTLPHHMSWLDRVQGWRLTYPVLTPELRQTASGVSTYECFEKLSERLCADDILVQGSAGVHSEIFFMTFATKLGQRIIADGSLGAMGYGIPAAIGACLAGGRRRTILIDGDGSLMPNIQELEVIRRLGLPIKIVVISNNGYSSIRISQDRWFKRKIAADSSSGLTLPALDALAAAFKIPFYRITNLPDLLIELDKALTTESPAVIEVFVPQDEDRQPRLANYQKADGSLASKPLEDLFPFLDRTEFLSNMVIPIVDT